MSWSSRFLTLYQFHPRQSYYVLCVSYHILYSIIPNYHLPSSLLTSLYVFFISYSFPFLSFFLFIFFSFLFHFPFCLLFFLSMQCRPHTSSHCWQALGATPPPRLLTCVLSVSLSISRTTVHRRRRGRLHDPVPSSPLYLAPPGLEQCRRVTSTPFCTTVLPRREGGVARRPTRGR